MCAERKTKLRGEFYSEQEIKSISRERERQRKGGRERGGRKEKRGGESNDFNSTLTNRGNFAGKTNIVSLSAQGGKKREREGGESYTAPISSQD